MDMWPEMVKIHLALLLVGTRWLLSIFMQLRRRRVAVLPCRTVGIRQAERRLAKDFLVFPTDADAHDVRSRKAFIMSIMMTLHVENKKVRSDSVLLMISARLGGLALVAVNSGLCSWGICDDVLYEDGSHREGVYVSLR